jgi:hypothetical protein
MKVLGFIRDAILDGQRRKHVISRVIEGYVPTALVVLAVTWAPESPLWIVKALAWSVAATFGQFALYEFVLEPLGKTRNPLFTTGRYWERGPREDETFTRP